MNTSTQSPSVNIQPEKEHSTLPEMDEPRHQVKSPSTIKSEEQPLSPELILRYFFRIYKTTFWFVLLKLFLYVVTILITILLLIYGYSLVQKQTNAQFQMYFGIAGIVVSLILLVSLLKHQPLLTTKKWIAEWFHHNIVFHSYLKQMEVLSDMLKELEFLPVEKKLRDSKMILTQMEKLTASILSELDNMDEL